LDPSIDPSEEFDVDGRNLCPDGNCTGLIGEDGCCKVCGLREGQTLTAPLSPTNSAEPSDEFDDDDRELCSDGNCTGLLGADGRCKVCGKSS
jgi:hypothetical protein